MNLLDEGFLDSLREDGDRVGSSLFFKTTADFFGMLGFEDAADKLRYYRSGGGKPLTISDEEMARHPAYSEAVDQNRTRFNAETFTGLSDSGKLANKILAIPDGGSGQISDFWDKAADVSNPATYLNLGRFGVQSRGDFEVSRRGNDFTFLGTVDHHLGGTQTDEKTGERKYKPETFDFNEGQPGKRQADIAERNGDAAPFIVLHPKRQQVEASVTYDPDSGKFTVNKAEWSPMADLFDVKPWNNIVADPREEMKYNLWPKPLFNLGEWGIVDLNSNSDALSDRETDPWKD
jgi:hypothetical protein